MSLITYKEQSTDFELENFLIIKVNDMFTFWRNYNMRIVQIHIDDYSISTTILPSTKTSELFNFTKSNIFLKYLIHNLNENNMQLIDKQTLDYIENICSQNIENIEINQSWDIGKILSSIIDIDKDRIITKKELLSWFKLLSNSNQRELVMLFDVEWFEQEILKELSTYKIPLIIITNSLPKWKNVLIKHPTSILIEGVKRFYQPSSNEIETISDDEKEKIYVTL